MFAYKAPMLIEIVPLCGLFASLALRAPRGKAKRHVACGVE